MAKNHVNGDFYIVISFYARLLNEVSQNGLKASEWLVKQKVIVCIITVDHAPQYTLCGLTADEKALLTLTVGMKINWQK